MPLAVAPSVDALKGVPDRHEFGGCFRDLLVRVGDLTLLHDGNGLLIGPAEPRPDLTIVVANGGGIFGC